MSELLNTLLAQEEELQLNDWTNEDAFRLGCLIVEVAKERGVGISVHIENDEHPLFTHYMAGTNKGNTYWMKAKSNVVNRFGHSSLYVGETFRSQGQTFHEGSGLPESDYQGEGGSFPIVVHGQGKVGTVTVSGLPGEEDHAVAVEGLRRLLAGK